jgi:hypothetical protein
MPKPLVALCEPDVEFHSRIAEAEHVTYRGQDGLRDYVASMSEAFEWIPTCGLLHPAAGLRSRSWPSASPARNACGSTPAARRLRGGGPPDHLPVSQQTGLPHRLLDRDAAQCSSHPEMRDAPVARSANVDQLPSHVLKRAANALPPRPNALVTPKVVPSASATIEVNSTSSAVSARNALKSRRVKRPKFSLC